MTSTQTTNPNPFALLGEEVTAGKLLTDQMAEAGADFPAQRRHLAAVTLNPDGTIDIDSAILAEEIAIVRTDEDTVLGIHSPKYTFQPFMEVARIAQEIVELRGDEGAKITNIGTYDGGRKFFVNMFMGEFAVDPMGIDDRFISSITGFSSHDASLANLFREGELRLACNNMLGMIRAGQFGLGYRIKHTKHMPERVVHAVAAITQHDDGLKTFKAEANQMQQISFGLDRVEALVDAMYPVDPDSKRAVTLGTARKEAIVRLFEGPSCAGKVGKTGWAAYNAVTEYIDHYRPDNTTEERAVLSITPGGHVERKKQEAGRRVLALAA